jgi:SUMO ligase MMS21 Smc5/6 complex component
LSHSIDFQPIMTQFDRTIDKALANLERTMKLIAECSDANDTNDVTPFTAIAEQILASAQSHEDHTKALEVAATKTYEEFDSSYTEALEQAGTNSVRLSDRFKRFEADAKALFANVAARGSANNLVNVDDDVAVTNTVSNIDPITKQPIRCAVRNQKCGHIYDKSSIKESLRFNARLRCPIMGCANKQFVTMGDLVEDAELQRQFDSMEAEDSDEEEDDA